MPSLKDLRNRIASVKATQKITKAMQMVAAAKLRRAQLAAEAARPYAERMDKVLANLAASIGTGGEAPPLLSGGGGDHHLLVVCTAERGLCGAFNSSIARLARDTAISLMGQGKTVKILCVGKKGHDVLRRQFGRQIIETIDLRAVRSLSFADADAIGRKIVALHAAERVRRLHDILLALSVGDRANPDGAANHPSCFAGGREGRAIRCVLRVRAGRGRNPRGAFAAQYFHPSVAGVA